MIPVRAPLLVATLFAAACIAPSPPAPPDLARPIPKLAVAAPAAAAPPPVTAEVEMGGTVQRPPGVKGDVTVWVTDGPCWQPTTHAFGESKAKTDNFFIEVFVKQGTPLWLCAAVTDGKKPLTVYGQPDKLPLLGKGLGEVTFTGQVIGLQKGKRVTAPPPPPNPSPSP